LSGADGVYSVFIDAGTGNATVSYDSTKTSAQKLAQTLRARGYSVDEVKILK
jgi:copper chaperone CopZ